MLAVVLGEIDVDVPPVNVLTLLASVASTTHAHPVDGINILSASAPPEEEMVMAWSLVH